MGMGGALGGEPRRLSNGSSARAPAPTAGAAWAAAPRATGPPPARSTSAGPARRPPAQGMEKRSAGQGTPAGLLAVQHPPALAPLLQHHHRRHTGLEGEHHAPAEAPLLLIHQHPLPGNRGEPRIGHRRRTEGPAPQAAPRQGRQTAPPSRAAGHRSPVGAGLRSPGARAAAWGGPEGGTWGEMRGKGGRKVWEFPFAEHSSGHLPPEAAPPG